MKRNISDLLDEYLAEDLDLGGRTPYSKSRIKEITMNQINSDTHSNQPVKHFKPARLLIAAAVAAVAAALSVSVFAAGQMLGAGSMFQDFFAKEDSALTQEQLDVIDQLGQSAGGTNSILPAAVTDSGATITPLASLADDNVCYIRLRVNAPEGTVLPDLDGDTDGYYQLPAPLTSDLGTYMRFGQGELNTILDDDPSDNCKDFVLCFNQRQGETNPFDDGTPKLLTIDGLWIQSPSKEYTPVFTGNFVFDFGPSFQTQAQLIQLEAAGLTWSTQAEFPEKDISYDVTNTVQSMALSPLSLSYHYTTTLPENPWIGSGLGPVEVVMKDGTAAAYAGGYDMETGTQEFDGFITFDQPLDLTQVDYVQYGDHRIPVNAE